MVGAIAAQSLSEPTTQMTLNTFHNAGISSKNVTLGVPRIKELLNKANTKTPGLIINLKKEFKYDKKHLIQLSSDLAYKTLKSLCYRTEIYFEQNPLNSVIDPKNEAKHINVDEELQTTQSANLYESIKSNPDKLSPWVLRILLTSDIPYEGARQLERILIGKIKNDFKEVEQKTEHKIRFAVLHTDFSLSVTYDQCHPEIRVLMIRENPEAAKEQDELRILKRLEISLVDQDSIKIQGFETIKKIYIKDIKGKDVKLVNHEDGSVKKDKDHYAYETDGSDLMAAGKFDYIDFSKLRSNDVNEIYRVLGIEAARRCLLEEIRGVLSSYGIYINARHLLVLCDTMCHRGKIMAINRNGINRIDVGPLRKCSFEETLEMLLAAAAFGAVDPLLGMSENIMVGQLCRLGTGYFDLLFDVKKAMTEMRYMPDAVMPHDDDDRNIINEPIGMDAIQTPNIINTPGPYLGGATPHLGSLYIPSDNAFTPNPYNTFQSPAYGTPGRQITSVNSPGLAMASPVYLDPRSPMLPGPSPSQHSPQYSPNLASMHYNPISPHYSPSASPSMSSGGGAGRVYSPSSPGYTSSPKYSPGYVASPSSNTPSSQNPNTASYTPTQNLGIYNPSPQYDPNKAIPEEKEGEDEEEEDKN